MLPCKRRDICRVALRKESVDRNYNATSNPESVDRNVQACKCRDICRVALRKESVDRNLSACSRAVCSACRSPQGERGYLVENVQ